MRTRKYLTILMTFTAILTLFAGCSDDNGGDDESTPESSIQQCPAPNSDKQPAPADLPIGCAESTAETTESTTTTEPEDIYDRADVLEALPDEECATKDAYAFLAPSGPRVYSDGAEFYYDCRTDFFGYYFSGRAGDAWTELPIDRNLLDVPTDAPNSYDTSLPLEYSGAPVDRHHPVYSDALTVEELEPGLVVCIHDEDDEANALPGVTDTVKTVFTHITLYTDGSYVMYPGWISENWEEYKRENPGAAPRSLADYGLMPHPFGRWSTVHVTAGPC